MAISSTRIIALFGATGKCGRFIVRNLLAQAETKNLKLRIYVRAKAKLVALAPGIDKNLNVEIFVGALTDVDLMKRVVADVDIIVSTLGENNNIPGIRVLQDGADSVIAALEHLKANQKEWKKPHVYYLSSSTWNERFAAARPPFVHWLIKTAFSHPYADLRKAQAHYLESTGLVTVTLIQPPVLIEEEGTGYEISTEAVRLAASYEDLGAAFTEMILEDKYRTMAAVGVSSKLGDRPARYAPEILRRLFWGMFAHVKSILVWSTH